MSAVPVETVSVAMATYNAGPYLAEQLNSFAIQTRTPDELVVCDDGSRDQTLKTLEEFQARAPFTVRIFQNAARLGFTGNFSEAMSRCTGDVVFLADQDDVWYEEKIAIVMEVFARRKEIELVVHDADLVNERLESAGATYLQQVLAGYGTSRSLVTGALTAVRRRLLQHALPVPSGIVGHDGWLHSIADYLRVRDVIPTKLQAIRRHSSNTSGWIASSVQPISQWDVMRSQARTRVAPDYSDRARINEECASVLRRVQQLQHKYSEEAIRASLEYLARERQAIQARTALTRSRWPRQKLLSIAMLCRGEYAYFNGYRSFLRDLAR